MKLIAMSMAISADIPTEPAPIRATVVREILAPPNTSTRKPMKGITGINHNSSSISPSHLAGCIHIQRPKRMVKPDKEGQTH